MSLNTLIGPLCSAATLEAVVHALQQWVDGRYPGGVLQLLVTDRGTGRLIGGPAGDQAHAAHERGELAQVEDATTWTAWVPLRGLGGPIGVLGLVFPRAAVPGDVLSGLTELRPLVAMAVDRVSSAATASVYTAALTVQGSVLRAAAVVASERAELLYYSDGMERLTGWTAEEVRARGFFECVYPDPAQRARAVLSTRETLSGNAAVDVPWWLTHRNGQVAPCRLHSSRVIGPDQRRYIVATFLDHTAAEREATELHHVELGRFAASVNHDFNNLLAVVQGHSEVLLGHTDPEVRSHAQDIQTVADRATRLTRQLAAFGRDQPLFRVPTDLGPICDETIRQFRAVPGRPAVSFSVAADLPPVELDPSAVRHLFVNLLENAADAAGASGRVAVELKRGDPPRAPLRGAEHDAAMGWVRLRIGDDGPGFTEEARRKLFEPFYTSKGVGRGLGLAAVASLADALQAMVDVPQQVGRGAIVDVYLPIATRSVAPEPVVRDPVAGGEETIWVVDDDHAVRMILALGLESFGYRVRQFAEGEELLAAFDAGERLDLLVSDLVMPGLDGVGLYRALRGRGSTTPVLFVSGYAKGGVDVPQEVRTDFVSKPVSARVLAEKARRLLNYVFPAG